MLHSVLKQTLTIVSFWGIILAQELVLLLLLYICDLCIAPQHINSLIIIRADSSLLKSFANAIMSSDCAIRPPAQPSVHLSNPT